MSAVIVEPLSWQAIEYVGALLARMRIANGYLTDAGLRVVDEPVQITPADNNKLITMLAATQFDLVPEKSNDKLRYTRMTVQIDVMVPIERTDAQRRTHRVMADLHRALGNVAAPRPQYVGLPEIQSRTFFNRPEGASVVVVQVIAQLGLSERLSTA